MLYDENVQHALITHADCLKHEMGAHHPERPERLSAIVLASIFPPVL